MAANLAGFIIMCITRYLDGREERKRAKRYRENSTAYVAKMQAEQQKRKKANEARKRQDEMKSMKERIAKLEKELSGWTLASNVHSTRKG
jgi:ATPase subunit of ABC transporter with duplicated ATPase domains